MIYVYGVSESMFVIVENLWMCVGLFFNMVVFDILYMWCLMDVYCVIVDVFEWCDGVGVWVGIVFDIGGVVYDFVEMLCVE